MHEIGTRLFEHATETQLLPAGAILFEAGDAGEIMYVVKAGELEIQFDGAPIERLGPNAIVGEMGLVSESHTRSATVKALTESEVVPIDRRMFMFLCERSPFFAIEVMRVMAARIRDLDERLYGVKTPA